MVFRTWFLRLGISTLGPGFSHSQFPRPKPENFFFFFSTLNCCRQRTGFFFSLSYLPTYLLGGMGLEWRKKKKGRHERIVSDRHRHPLGGWVWSEGKKKGRHERIVSDRHGHPLVLVYSSNLSIQQLCGGWGVRTQKGSVIGMRGLHKVEAEPGTLTFNVTLFEILTGVTNP